MSEQQKPVSDLHYQKASDKFGYTYVKQQQFDQSSNQLLFQGILDLQSLACGMDLCASELFSVRDSKHEGMLQRSFTIAINLNNEPTNTKISNSQSLCLNAFGGAIVANADTLNMSNEIKAGLQTKCLLVQICPEKFMDDDIAQEIDKRLTQTNITNFLLSPEVHHLASRITHSPKVGGISQLFSESAALELLAHTMINHFNSVKTNSTKLNDSDLSNLYRVRDFILANPSMDFTLPMLAKEAGMSISSLKEKFPKVFHLTVFRYISDVRLQYSKLLICEKGWPISKVAYHCGYAHQASFTAAFKRRFGLRPSDLNMKY